MRNVLILAAARGGYLEDGRAGDLFDMALVEIVRVLDVPASVGSVLVPWSTDLAALIAVGIFDTAPSFDPEGGAGTRTEASRSGLVPYLPPDTEWSAASVPFFESSHLALDRDAPMPFAEAIKQYPPTYVIVLAWTEGFSQLGDALSGTSPAFFTFGKLAPPERVASGLNIPISQVEDLELRLPPIVEGSDIPESSEFAGEREGDVGLEPFIPFGLLIQDALDDLLPDDEPLLFRDRER
jgi:hypothetical protein